MTITAKKPSYLERMLRNQLAGALRDEEAVKERVAHAQLTLTRETANLRLEEAQVREIKAAMRQLRIKL